MKPNTENSILESILKSEVHLWPVMCMHSWKVAKIAQVKMTRFVTWLLVMVKFRNFIATLVMYLSQWHNMLHALPV